MLPAAPVFAFLHRGSNLLATKDRLISVGTITRGLGTVPAFWFGLIAFQLPPLASQTSMFVSLVRDGVIRQ